MTGSSNLNSTCPKETLWKNFWKKETIAISDNRRKLFKFSAIKFQQVCQNFILRVPLNIFMKKTFRWKKMIGVFSRIFAEFCGVFARLFFAGLSEHASYVSTEALRKIFFWKFFSFSKSGEKIIWGTLSNVFDRFVQTVFWASGGTFWWKIGFWNGYICSTFFGLWAKLLFNCLQEIPDTVGKTAPRCS